MLQLEQDIVKKELVDKITSYLKLKNDSKGKKYEVSAIFKSTIYIKKLKYMHLLGF